VEVYLGNAAILAASGCGLCVVAGCTGGWTAPLVGLAALLALANLAVYLPGAATAAGVAMAAAPLVAAVALLRRRPSPRRLPAAILVGSGTLAFASLPFVASGRVGIPGELINNDLSFHLVWADLLRETGPDAPVIERGYPLGPHALVAGLADVTGLGVQELFVALLLTTPVVTALAAYGAVGMLAPRVRPIAAGLCGMAYLPAAYLAQGSYKEPLMAAFVLGIALELRRLTAGEERRWPLVALAVLTAGCLACWGPTGIAWPAAVLVAVLGAHVLSGRMRRREAATPLPWRALAIGGALAAVAAAAAVIATPSFFEGGTGRFLLGEESRGNFTGPLSPFTGLGIWRSTDFRGEPQSAELLWVAGCALALGAVVYGAVWWFRRDGPAMPAAALATVVGYAAATVAVVPYHAGKALVVAAPLLMLLAVSGLLGSEPSQPGWRHTAWTGLCAVFVLAAALSSADVLRASPVRPEERAAELRSFRPLIRGQPTLYLGRDDYAAWELRGARLATFTLYSGSNNAVSLSPRRGKATGPRSGAVDVDSPPSALLRSFRYVVAPRTWYASTFPPEFRPARVTRWFRLWRRVGAPSPPRSTLAEGEHPGRRLDCKGARPGAAEAWTRPEPLRAPAAGWRTPAGVRPAAAPLGPMVVQGTTLRQPLNLPRGRYELSLRYSSALPLELRAAGREVALPPYLGDAWAFWHAADVDWQGGALPLELEVAPRRRFDIERSATVGEVVATPLGRPGAMRPLARSCGAYVDWYRQAG
jgi:hypothetical protein